MKYTQDTFIKKSIEIHGNKYEYSKINYIDFKTPILITCKKHGDFLQRPINHLKGYGCKKCQYEYLKERNAYSLETFLKKAIEKYGDEYTYEHVNYINSSTKVLITCKKHGDFLITPNDFLDGHKCKKCSNETRSKKKSLNKNLFVEKAKQVHGNKYDYSKVEYVNNENKVCIICPEHGEFLQTPHSHLSGCGCKKCGIESRIEKIKSTKETFIKKASFVHDNIYNYSLIKDYKNGKQKIPIICKKHGVFYQRAEDHLQGHGCSCCVTSSIENEISKFLKDNDIQFIQQYRNKNILGKLSLDFYLPDYNIAIECQGLQHFKPVNFSNKNNENIYENFEKQIDRDKEKHNLCEQNGIRLLYFSNLDIIYPYKVYTNKEELLTEIKNG